MLRRIAKARQPQGVEIMWGDDQADPETAVTVARSFVGKAVSVVIGHFNSECARAVAPWYLQHEIPLLLPASTAPDICAEYGPFRLCAAEPAQIQSMSNWFHAAGFKAGSIWHDESLYGRRLAKAAKQAMPICVDHVNTESHAAMPVFLFGSHYRVAEKILLLCDNNFLGPFIVCDDCAIEEFDQLVATRPSCEILVARPNPSYEEAVEFGFDLIAQLMPGRRVTDQIYLSGCFVGGERTDAGFKLTQVTMGASSLKHYMPDTQRGWPG